MSGEASKTVRLVWAVIVVATVWLGRNGLAEAPAQLQDRPCELRVESDLFSAGGDEPIARSLTLFHQGVAWDFLEIVDAETKTAAIGEIVLHDPARERVVVIDPVRHVKTQVDMIRLERLSVSLAKWARSNDDRLVRWAGGPDFTAGFTEEDERIELVGPRVRYAVAYEEAPCPEAAGNYRRFADTAILLKALMQPGGIPPFPRLAVNRRLEDAGAIPSEVTLEIEPRLIGIAGRPERLRCVHKVHPRLLGGDLERIEDAQGHVAAAEAVNLATFIARDEEPPRPLPPGS
jgi:hypothetical protein